jgi:hypothetical protein
MKSSTARWWPALLVVLAVALIGAGCGDGDDSDPSADDAAAAETTEAGPTLADQWAGTVEGTDSYISVFTLSDGQTGAYVADGDQIAVLALGTLTDGELALSSEDGAEVTGTAAGDSAEGTVTLEGEDYAFSAEAATGDAGWYRARTEVDGQPVAAGYIVLADGSQRGAVRLGDEVIGAPELDTSDPTIEVDEVGELTLLPVAEFVIEEGGIS